MILGEVTLQHRSVNRRFEEMLVDFLHFLFAITHDRTLLFERLGDSLQLCCAY